MTEFEKMTENNPLAPDKGKKRLSLHLDENIHSHLKAYCALKKININYTLDSIVRDFLVLESAKGRFKCDL